MNNDHKHAKREVTRRQFLTYTLGGTGGFLAACMIFPMARFAVDPLLQKKGGTDFVKVVEVNKLSEEPKSFSFQVHIKDGWHETDSDLTAWITKDSQGNILALSPICKHLGCTIDWNTDPRYPSQYFCPCHEAHYTKEGKNMAVAPEPLDEYEVEIRDGWVYLGKLKKNRLSGAK